MALQGVIHALATAALHSMASSALARLRRAKSGIARAVHGAKVNLPVNILFLAQIAKFEGNVLRRLYEITVNLQPVTTIG